MSSDGRRRRAPRAERTSDLTRLRGVAAAAAVAAAVVVIAALALSDRDARRGAPGPLARPHRLAGLDCASCHTNKPVVAACVTCHGAHASTRAAHRELAARAALPCTRCHRAHGGHGGVAFLPDGRAIRYGGTASAHTATSFRPAAVATVPLVPLAACAGCHDAASPRDPIAACVIADQAALGLARPTVCFDEHQPVRGARGELPARTAAWEAARQIAAALPAVPEAPGRGAPVWWLALGALAAAATFAGVRTVDRRRRHLDGEPAVPRVPDVRRLPVINAATCLGCHACVDACPFDVLEVHRYVATVARPADCCGLTLCEQKCPNGSLVMGLGVPAETASPVDDSLESRTVPGLYLAGDVTGLSLIRNAIQHGALAVRHIAARVAAAPAGDALDLLIIGAGPAGLSAALEAKAHGLRSLALEQATVVESIRSFPRGKLVADPDLPVVGPLWLAESTKEELLARWLQTMRQQQPAIREGQRVTAVEPAAADGGLDAAGGGFVVHAVDLDGNATTYRARFVLLAVGRRGSPRRLPIEIPPAFADHVHYSLADARSFAGRRVLVVGLGDVAMEAAIALSRQAGTEVVVSYRGSDFARGKQRNIAEMRRRVASSTLRLVWQSEVRALASGRAVLSTPTGPLDVPCDSVFVFIGSIPPEDLLRPIGALPDRSAAKNAGGDRQNLSTPDPFNRDAPAPRGSGSQETPP